MGQLCGLSESGACRIISVGINGIAGHNSDNTNDHHYLNQCVTSVTAGVINHDADADADADLFSDYLFG
ncbi:hypothetical protein GCM10023116_42490 [Kistimonas scapharcae]|uniref:Uncharacterized protein n=1 Tax=Kistimonas scapharcae TaxID=1036133 RepID=A0ABP8VAC1_9GAMM